MNKRVLEYNKKNIRKKKRRQTLQNNVNKTIKALIVTLGLMIFSLLITLFITNNRSQKGYTLEQEKLKRADLKIQNEILTTEITESTAFTNIKNSEKINKMIDATKKIYIKLEDLKIK